MPERHSVSGQSAVWLQTSLVWFQRSVEEHSVDAIVVVEIFDVPKRLDGAADMGVQLRSAMCGQWDVKRIAQRCDLEEARVAAATGGICLKAVY